MTAMVDAVHHLAKCPILGSINIQKAVEVSLRMEKFELAALLLPFCEKSNRSDVQKVS